MPTTTGRRAASFPPLALALAAALAAAAGCVGDDSPPADGTPTPSPDGSGDAAVTVELQDYEYEPTRVEAAPGATIRLVNVGEEPHSFTSATDRDLFDVDVPAGATGEATAPSTPGEYRFFCFYHASASTPPGDGMAGVLVVTE